MKPSQPVLQPKPAVLVFDPQSGQLASLNESAVEMLGHFGCATPEALRLSAVEKLITSGGTMTPGIRLGGMAGQTSHEFRTCCKRPDGSVIALSRVWSADANTVLIVEDVTRAAQEDRRGRLAQLIVERMTAAQSLAATLDALLQAICLCGGWSYGEAWMPKGPILARMKVRQAHGKTPLHPARDPAQPSPVRTDVCPAIVTQAWRAGDIQHIGDLQEPGAEDRCGYDDARAAGYGGFVALPLKIGSSIVAVLVFGFAQAKACDRMTIELLQGIAEQLAMALKCRLLVCEETSARKQLGEILMAAGDAIVSVDARHRIRLFNRQAEQIFGYAQGEVIGQHLHMLLPDSARAAHARHLEGYDRASAGTRLMGGRPEIRGRRKDGSEFPAEASISKTIIDDEVVYTAVVRDLTALKEAQAALVASEEKMRTIVESMPFGLSICLRKGGDILFANEAFCTLVEAEPAGIIGHRIAEFVDLEPGDAAEGRTYGTERLVRTAAGKSRWCMAAAVPLSLGGKDTLLCGYYDVTDRRVAVEALRISARNLSEAERIAHLGNWQWDVATNSLKWSDETFRIFGVGPGKAELSYDVFRRYVHNDDRGEVDRSIQLALAESDRYEKGFRIVTATGATRYLHLQAEIERDEAGGARRMMGTVQDMTDLNRVKEELRAARNLAESANRAKSQFLANMSHELRTPLNAIIGFSELMALDIMGPLGPDRCRDYARDINESGRSLLNIVNDILDLSNIEIEGASLEESEFDIGEIIDGCVRKFARQIEGSRLAVNQDVPRSMAALLADERLFVQMMRNLLSNAIKFTPEGGTISIAARTDADGGLCIVVEDSGIGIAPDDMERIQQPFIQVEGHLSRRFVGAGLGLALTKEYARLHGATLLIRSEIGEGTSVEIRFPPARVLVSPGERFGNNGKNLFLVK